MPTVPSTLATDCPNLVCLNAEGNLIEDLNEGVVKLNQIRSLVLNRNNIAEV